MKVKFLNMENQEDIMNQPSCDFVQDFILNQLEIKRRNIFALFHPMQEQMV